MFWLCSIFHDTSKIRQRFHGHIWSSFFPEDTRTYLWSYLLHLLRVHLSSWELLKVKGNLNCSAQSLTHITQFENIYWKKKLHSGYGEKILLYKKEKKDHYFLPSWRNTMSHTCMILSLRKITRQIWMRHLHWESQGPSGHNLMGSVG